jgi:hypothetical protein
MRALARTASIVSRGKQNVPPFKGGTREHSMPAAIGVNRSGGHRQAGNRRYPRKNLICDAWMTEHVDALTRTLAPESGHIVAFGLLGTTSRAAVLILYRPIVRRKRPGALAAPGEG